jgi:site-specific DNA recombinase
MIARAPIQQRRVAIYCRKSVTEGLQQEFNSLDAQREACEAYVRSQQSEGWVALDTRYDDGGFSGATTERPAFQRLLDDVERGRIDVIAVYKIDRLSRSLRDFAKLIDLFERHQVTFVSVTQSFSTGTSMGRLTLNMLMSFAEYEREVIGERIRDKKRASRSRGMWTGGRPPLGYVVVDKKLVPCADEAAQVRETFRLYAESNSLRELVAETQRRGWRSKVHQNRHGRPSGGLPFSKTTLDELLRNPLYRGLIRCGDELVRGAHEPIVDAELWDAVQARLRENAHHAGAATRNKTGAQLRGLVHCGRCGSPLLHTFSTKQDRRFRYYVCARAHNEGTSACPGTRVAAGKFEKFVVDQIRAMGRDEDLLARTAAAVEQLAEERREQLGGERTRIERWLGRSSEGERDATLEQRRCELATELERFGDAAIDPDHLRTALASFDPVWEQLFPAERERILRLLVERITYHPDGGDVEITLRRCGIQTLAEEAQEAS